MRNDNCLKTGGFLGRWDYFLCVLRLEAIYWFGWTIMEYGQSIFSLTGVFVLLFALLVLICFIYLTGINLFKRIRDIRGTDVFSGGERIAWVIAFLVPGINLLFGFYLLFAPGALGRRYERRANQSLQECSNKLEAMRFHRQISEEQFEFAFNDIHDQFKKLTRHKIASSLVAFLFCLCGASISIVHHPKMAPFKLTIDDIARMGQKNHRTHASIRSVR